MDANRKRLNKFNKFVGTTLATMFVGVITPTW
jgi:hypothetical protein